MPSKLMALNSGITQMGGGSWLWQDKCPTHCAMAPAMTCVTGYCILDTKPFSSFSYGQKNRQTSLEGRVFALQVTDLGSILKVACGLLRIASNDP